MDKITGITEYNKAKEQIDLLQRQLAEFDQTAKATEKLAEETRSKAEKHGVSLEDLFQLLCPKLFKQTQTKQDKAQPKTRAKRRMKVYKHPETGEELRTKGGNKTELVEWKKKHGASIVESWARFEDEPEPAK